MLWKKMFRDIWSNKGSYIAILSIVLIGLIVFTSFSIVSNNMRLSKENFYQEENFADGFIELQSIPQARVDRLVNIEGIKNIEGRIVKEARVYDPEKSEPVYLDLVSLDPDKPDRINDVRLLEGNELTGGNLEIWLDNQFFDTHELAPGDKIDIIAEGRVMELSIMGQGMSPEFTYPLRTEAQMFPNPDQYGIAFLPLEDMTTLYPEMANRVNDLVFTLKPGVNFDQVEDRLESELEQYGLKTIYSRDDHASHTMLSEEVDMLERVSLALPLTVLGIAGIILFIMSKRMIEQQRGQIGILKAFGYTNWEVMLHYLSYGIVIGTTGGIAGGLLGIYLATPLSTLLLEFFNMPSFYEGFSLYYLLLGILLSVAVFLLASFLGCRRVLQLKPAEAMQPPSPIIGKKIILEKLSFIWAAFTIQGKMAVRNLFRNRGRSTFLFVGITLSCAVVILTWSLNDMIDKLIFYQYEEVETYDARVTLSSPGTRKPVIRELIALPEVGDVEPISEIPVTFTHKWSSEDVVLIGVLAGSRMYNIVDSDGNRVELTEGGVVLSDRLADKLQVKAGSTLELETPYLENSNDTKIVQVDRVIPQYLGMNAYMEINFLENVLGQGKIATGAMVNIANNNTLEGVYELRERYFESDKVAAIEGLDERISQSKELIETFGNVIYLYVLIGVVICFAIIYSSSFIILSERSRELASMRVLGMTSTEAFSVITFEQWFISIFAVIAAIPLAQLMQLQMAKEFSTDFYAIPSEISATSLIAGAAITLLSIWLAQRFALRKVRQLSLVEVLKSRE